MGIYDRTLLLVTHPAPPTSSWWVGLQTREDFMVASRRERPRICRQVLSPNVRKALAELDAERRRVGIRP